MSSSEALECPLAIAGCRAEGADEAFANAVTAPFGVSIECDGSSSEPFEEIEGHLWFLDSPDDGLSFLPFAGRTRVDFFPSTSGVYVVELDVIGPGDEFSCAPARAFVVVEEPE